MTIISEIGVNHNGDVSLAKKMVDASKACGADMVKFQLGIPELFTTTKAGLATYQKEQGGEHQSQQSMLKKIMLSFEEMAQLKEYCDQVSIGFLCTPFDLASAYFLNELGVDTFKIPSGEMTNVPYIETISGFGKKILLSTGMSHIQEIGFALDCMIGKGLDLGQITLLHCTSQYPTPLTEAHLQVISTLAHKFHTKVGFSDHTLGMTASLGAVALGAVVIEKHFTLDRKMSGPDHHASMTPAPFKKMVKEIRKMTLALGVGEKKVLHGEKEIQQVARKSIVAKVPIQRGTIFTQENLTTKRPALGCSPILWHQVLGTVAQEDYEVDDFIKYPNQGVKK